jgi:TonB family protein
MTLRLKLRWGFKWQEAQRAKTRSVAISLAGHATAFVLLMNAPEIKLPQASPSAYQLAIAGKEEKLVWYQFKKEMPNVTPPDAKAEAALVRAETMAKQQIVASPKDAPKQTQIVWTDAPVLPETALLESPNILAVRMPDVKLPPKLFVPPDIVKPELAKVEIPLDAPQIAPPPLSPVALPQPKFVKAFVPPPRQVPKKLQEVAPPPETPSIVAEARPEVPKLDFAMKLPPRPFVPPLRPAEPAKQVSVSTPPELAPAPISPLNAEALVPKNLNLAVVGLKPVDQPAPLPKASSPGQFSAGPVIRPDGANAAGDGKGVSVPDLFVRGEDKGKPDLIAQAFAAPTSSANLREAMRAAAAAGLATPFPPPAPKATQSGAIQVSAAPDPRFNGREVYMMAIQMPNLTSYSGSWLMWYADHTQHQVDTAPIAPPVAWRKVDPKYIASAVTDRIEGKVRLSCVIGKDGRVSTIDVVNGLDERLNQSAEEALSKWEFTPASRHGEPVEVDVLVEIPFKLEPHKPISY